MFLTLWFGKEPRAAGDWKQRLGGLQIGAALVDPFLDGVALVGEPVVEAYVVDHDVARD